MVLLKLLYTPLIGQVCVDKMFAKPLSFVIGVSHLIPYNALVKARDCFKPREYNEDDDVELLTERDGQTVTLRKDWFRPPVAKLCPCQQSEVPSPCNCGLGQEPSGVSRRLYWDKTNNENR